MRCYRRNWLRLLDKMAHGVDLRIRAQHFAKIALLFLFDSQNDVGALQATTLSLRRDRVEGVGMSIPLHPYMSVREDIVSINDLPDRIWKFVQELREPNILDDDAIEAMRILECVKHGP